ncbi:TPA: gamma-glutamyl-gamma-aminobutyrate hydrolase family protein [Streptococcus suis]|uniref:gamma-glutamyl-gamma-aminobutyrate hydrolase family protein n=1 Tax=Streptococcus parasuis TaxID=1501662 RepID=UPI0023789137|nr:gamma-glutamyl-gamma-aminobutyrate hydrolase family protein [Streptococcus parasuis]HEM3654755.1 gamma-glutamyl-gamma-aminobutyrate hydrolase family protein [Streptococcus suis]WDN59370.1 gamma-glutamyl-gamma-aminobutyrate hydrolase family protein [Streptococcus parasuis]WDN61203.1 gamma-glutamyl-gamma-aminobutyrate hydrolase family protein [Streptococcus parasuis]WFB92826.1 gamma-glutamyl-gamma-aminobutyrate hydrolase family protein [Streptococcus parasuis]HEM3679239.1 gamma-glutamyl-gamma
MSQPIIGISGNHYKTGDHTEPLLSYTQTCLVNAIEDAGGIPLILPVTRPELAEQYMKLVDKLVLTGGQNVEPIHYQEKLLIDSSNYFPERDRFELALIEAAHHQEKPIFGICRGMQLYNVAQGGSLHQEVLGHWQENTGNQPSQDLYFPIETQLSQIYAQEPTVNSFHRQAINKLAPSLEIIALSPDKQTIEAVQSTRDSHTFLGVQWHPELLYGERETENRLFDYIVNQF